MFIPIDTPFPPLEIYPTETLPQACKDTPIKRFPSAVPLLANNWKDICQYGVG